MECERLFREQDFPFVWILFVQILCTKNQWESCCFLNPNSPGKTSRIVESSSSWINLIKSSGTIFFEKSGIYCWFSTSIGRNSLFSSENLDNLYSQNWGWTSWIKQQLQPRLVYILYYIVIISNCQILKAVSYTHLTLPTIYSV